MKDILNDKRDELIDERITNQLTETLKSNDREIQAAMRLINHERGSVRTCHPRK